MKRQPDNTGSSNSTFTKKAKNCPDTCSCPVLAPHSCELCAKIARKIYRLYGKRLALSASEIDEKAPVHTSELKSIDDFLVFADETCNCDNLNSEDCKICANFAIKMGVCMNIYSKTGIISPKYSTECKCAYISSKDCDSCQQIIRHLQKVFGKMIYPIGSGSIPSSPALSNRQVYPLRNGSTSFSSASSDGQVIALDCEMVGCLHPTLRTLRGHEKIVNGLARCSIVDSDLNVLLDMYIKPELPIVSYRTKYSGIRKCHMKTAVSYSIARKHIIDMIKDKVIVGHTLHCDLSTLNYFPAKSQQRDISECKLLRDMYWQKTKPTGIPGGPKVGLKKLSSVLLDAVIQQGSHCSVEDAIHTMKLYQLVSDVWEADGANGTVCKSDEELSESACCLPTGTNAYLADSYWSDSPTCQSPEENVL